jgi:hypothetical protein
LKQRQEHWHSLRKGKKQNTNEDPSQPQAGRTKNRAKEQTEHNYKAQRPTTRSTQVLNSTTEPNRATEQGLTKLDDEQEWHHGSVIHE